MDVFSFSVVVVKLLNFCISLSFYFTVLPPFLPCDYKVYCYVTLYVELC